MQVGLAMPLAVAALVGAVLGSLTLPGVFEAWALALLCACASRQRIALWMLLMAGLVAGQVLSARHAQLPQGLSGVDLRVEGRVVSLVDEGDERVRLRIDVEQCQPLESPRLPCERLRQVRVSAFSSDDWRVDERWALTVRLRPPRGFMNPHTFDYETWLWREGIDATGYVRTEPAAVRQAGPRFSLRRMALAHLDEQPLEASTRRWLAALTLGAGERLSADDWELLNASGTTHLMVISGLHVGLVASFALILARGVARLITPGRWRMAVWPWWVAAMASFAYAWLAGLEPPAMRAVIMTLVGLWVASGRHAPGVWQGWWLALALVVASDPLSVWRPGLWLSFVAVALLILIWQRRKRPQGIRGWCWALLRTQGLLAPMMAAAVLLAFERVAPVAPLVNLFAVPLVSVLMVPLGLIGWLLVGVPPLSQNGWWLFGQLAQGLVTLLDQAVAGLPLWQPPAWQVLPMVLVLGAVAMLWALPGLAQGLRVTGTALLAAMLFALEPPVIAEGAVRIRVHDVGQGQLIELRTANHRLLYDTGPRFRSGFMPLTTLWSSGQTFDRVVASHADIDHAGGVPALADHHVGHYLAPAGEDIGVPFISCLAGEGWHWDGVTFRFLWPPSEDSGEWPSNDRSCVLLVEAGEQRLLITGDVGAEVERRFLRQVSHPLQVLVAGHHGSRTSSGPQLVAELAPRHVIFSAGRDNAFGHPHDEVIRRFRRHQSCLWNTALDGAVTLWLGGADGPLVTGMRGQPGSGVEGLCHEVKSHP
ncbi:DNA internalization-related competence protein ComEC/Rec2 [Litchfieldella qijiaojingensis]|uniref:DNA internalization-related competence protein ComEC/Rec2 n=1 Tax=Litchfieldella qijiaojingensis TaxID=980347 RepID=A0ABQ2YE60_9GAMM|nr:DNA internalization-related competence protein ComEC/Rec2 [Halomonas qijiaojingensis]GGX81474.1 DNA internalization-related competence protein ComEC/Rec2 [Halomonas qijiaojingensis]